jgi:hypothetical protein
MARALGVEQRQRGIEGMQRTAVVHIVMLQGAGQIEFGGAHGAVGAGAVQQQIEAAPVALQTLHGGAQGLRIGHVQRQGQGAVDLLQRLRIARRHRHPRAALQ